MTSTSERGEIYLGIDVSTTSVKALLIDGAGAVVGQASTPLTLSTPRPLWAEQQPHDWWAACQQSIRLALAETGVDASRIGAIGLTGQMHGLVLLDVEGTPLRPAILWNDQRSAAECDAIRAVVGKDRLLELTGNDALPGFTAPKLLWVRAHEPEIFARARHVLLPKDYVRLQLTGEYAMDVADGSGTLLVDLRARDWSDEVLAALGLERGWFPPLFEGPAITGRVTAEAASATGLRAGTPVVAGGGDQAAGAVGVGAVTPGILAISLGTSGVVFAATEAPIYEPEGRLHAFCHALPGHWHLMGVMLSAAGSLQWYRDTLAPDTSFETLVAEAELVPAGSEGLLFLPYLSGERTPHPDPLARGAWVGLTVRHTRGHLTRALLEGVAFGLRDSLELMRGVGLPAITEIRISGGGARSRLWRQIVADILGVSLVIPTTHEGAAYGAALLAGVGAGRWQSVERACETIVVMPDVTPIPENLTGYESLYERYRALYPALHETFVALADIPVGIPSA
jgi:xylulokinase